MRILVRIIRTKNSQNIRQHVKSIKKPIFPGVHLPFPESKQSTAPEAFASKNRAAIANYWFLFIFFFACPQLLPVHSYAFFTNPYLTDNPAHPHSFYPMLSVAESTVPESDRVAPPGRVGNSCLLLMFDSLTAARVRSGLTIESYNISFQPRLTIIFFLLLFKPLFFPIHHLRG